MDKMKEEKEEQTLQQNPKEKWTPNKCWVLLGIFSVATAEFTLQTTKVYLHCTSETCEVPRAMIPAHIQ